MARRLGIMQETERFSPRYKGLDLWSEEDALAAFWDGQMTALAAVRPALPSIAAAARAMVERLGGGDGRLVYGGAGSSGLLAAQDGMEVTPTFGWPPERLLILVAGGDAARLRPMGVREDDAGDGERAVSAHRIGAADVVIGVAASGTTPYTVALLQGARSAGALTVAIANNFDTPLLQAAAHPIPLDTGPEVIAGSTRLGAGTAQKAALVRRPPDHQRGIRCRPSLRRRRSGLHAPGRQPEVQRPDLRGGVMPLRAAPAKLA